MGRRPYPGLDGLRGLAVLLVVVYHAWPWLLPGGAYGVTLFFVLSGFLITTVITREVDGSGSFELWRFYRRRAARLLPALVAVSGAFLLFGGSWSNTWPALAYWSNWSTIGGDALGGMQHTWSLSVEEHFYLIWPLLITRIKADWRAPATASLLAVAVGWRICMMEGSGFTRATIGTDTIGFALLAGCLLAVLPRRPRSSPHAVAAIVLLSLMVPRESWAWAWTELAVVLLAVLAVAAATGSVRWLEMGWLRWLGQISYGLYLWHHLLIRVGLPMWVGVSLSVLVAWLCWRSIEQPVLRLESQRRTSSKPVRRVGPVDWGWPVGGDRVGRSVPA